MEIFKDKILEINSGIPLYYKIKEILIQRITSGMYKPDELLPTEEDLSKEFSVSQGTVRRAMFELVSAGLITRRSGKGTFVRSPKIDYPLNYLFGFSDILKEKGLNPSTKVLDFKIIKADTSSLENTLKLNKNDEVISIIRLKFANDEPLYLEYSYLPYEYFSDLSKEELNSVSLYDLLRNKYDINLGMAQQYLEPVVVDEYEAKLLEIKVGAPALMVEGIVYSDRNEPVFLSKDILRGDRCRYFITIK